MHIETRINATFKDLASSPIQRTGQYKMMADRLAKYCSPEMKRQADTTMRQVSRFANGINDAIGELNSEKYLFKVASMLKHGKLATKREQRFLADINVEAADTRTLGSEVRTGGGGTGGGASVPPPQPCSAHSATASRWQADGLTLLFTMALTR